MRKRKKRLFRGPAAEIAQSPAAEQLVAITILINFANDLEKDARLRQIRAIHEDR